MPHFVYFQSACAALVTQQATASTIPESFIFIQPDEPNLCKAQCSAPYSWITCG